MPFIDIGANNVSHEKHVYSTLSVKSILSLACLLQALRAKSLVDIGPYDEDSEDLDLLDQINELFSAGLIRVSENSSTDTFSGFKSGDKAVKFYPNRAKWNVWVKDDRLSEKQLFELLKNPHPGLSFDQDEIITQYQELAIDVMTEIFEKYIADYRFTIKTDKEVDLVKESLNRWLVTYTPGQIYNLIWRSARQAYADIGSNKAGNYRYHPIHFIVKIMDQKAIQLAKKPKEFESYSYPFKVFPEPLKAQIFFGEMLVQPGWFLNPIPQLRVKKDLVSLASDRQLSEMIDQEWDDEAEIPKIVSEAAYYYVSDFGIVVCDRADEETLYSNQIAIYGAFKSYDVDEEHFNWFDLAKSVFSINRFYGLAYLMTLLLKLEQSNAIRKNDSDDL